MSPIVSQVSLLVLACLQSVSTLSLQSTQLSSVTQSTLHPLDSREAKFLSTFITIRNVACDSITGTQCLTKQDCNGQGGKASGLCLLGLGVCCDVDGATDTTTASPAVDDPCDVTATERVTNFKNPGYSDFYSTPGSCKLTVPLLNENICQMRIDFTKFQLSSPNTDGECIYDYFKVSGTINDGSFPLLCGENNGRHVYVDVNPALGSPVILKMFLDDNDYDRNWDFEVTQIDCDDPDRAPQGCLQYYTEETGTIESFNFHKGITTIQDAHTHLADMHYGACISSGGYCKIRYSKTGETDDNKYNFLMTGDPDLDAGPSFDEASEDIIKELQVSGDMCETDYISIPQGVYEDNAGVEQVSDKYCGLNFPTTVTSTASPFVLYVKTDSEEATNNGDVNNNGFSLNYVLSGEC